jgi:hypothetical protein
MVHRAEAVEAQDRRELCVFILEENHRGTEIYREVAKGSALCRQSMESPAFADSNTVSTLREAQQLAQALQIIGMDHQNPMQERDTQ